MEIFATRTQVNGAEMIEFRIAEYERSTVIPLPAWNKLWMPVNASSRIVGAF